MWTGLVDGETFGSGRRGVTNLYMLGGTNKEIR